MLHSFGMLEALNHVRDTVPYNTFREKPGMGAHLPEGFGGNCFYQSQKTAERLRAAGFNSEFLHAAHKSHAAPIVRIGKRFFYLDANLLQCEPICLTDVMNAGVAETFPAFPQIGVSFARVIITPTGNNTCKINYEKILPNKVRCYGFEYDLDDIHSTVPPDTVLHNRVPALRIVTTDGGVAFVSRQNNQFLVAARQGGKKPSIEASEIQDQRGFLAIVAQIADELEFSVGDILDLFKSNPHDV